MLELAVANLVVTDTDFPVPSTFGSWAFRRFGTYTSVVPAIKNGQCAVTFAASLPGITIKSTTSDLEVAMYEALDACLILSFLTARCVTVRSSAPMSDIQFISLPDHFPESRAIVGLPELLVTGSLGGVFQGGIAALQTAMAPRNLRLLLSLWVGAITCFNIEDLFMGVAVIMDVVKQAEIQAHGGCQISYYNGMKNASQRFGITPLSPDFKNMRNDLLHEGRLSGTNLPGRTKTAVATIVADTLNWLDKYVIAVLGIGNVVPSQARWRGADVALLPALSI